MAEHYFRINLLYVPWWWVDYDNKTTAMYTLLFPRIETAGMCYDGTPLELLN